MDTIGEDKIMSYDAKGKIKQMTCFAIRQSKACVVKNYMDLATRIATLQFNNPSHMLLFRGQRGDHKRTNKKALSTRLFRQVYFAAEVEWLQIQAS